MRRLLVVALAAAVLALAGCKADVPAPGAARVDVDTSQLRQLKHDAGVENCRPAHAGAVDGGLPDVTLPCLGGGPDVDVAGLRGPLVVNLWASWCGPCRREMPIYQRFFEQYGHRVGVLGIDYQDPQPTAALQLAAHTGATYPLLADPQTSLAGTHTFPVLRGLPWVVLVDADGTVVYKAAEEITSERQLVDLVDRHLGARL